MRDSDLFAAFESELSHLNQIAETEGLALDDSASPSDVLSFAECLLLCPTEDAARLQMQRDQKGATGFLAHAYSLKTELPRIGTSTSAQKPKNAAPFFVVASLVQEYLQKVKEYSPDDWY